MGGQLILGLGFLHPGVEVAVGLGGAVDEVRPELLQQRRPFGGREGIGPDIAKGHRHPRHVKRLEGCSAKGAGGEAVEGHGVSRLLQGNSSRDWEVKFST